jgi:hypothetical protein
MRSAVLQTYMGFGARYHHVGVIEGAAQSKAATVHSR